MTFTDIHTHILPGIDDGAQNDHDAFEMIDVAYDEGIRRIVFTPHYHPGVYGDTYDAARLAFEKTVRHCSTNYPDLVLYLGNELHYSKDCVSHLQNGRCRTLNDTDYVLIDFTASESNSVIVRALQSILNTGYRPVLAHAERYKNLTVSQIDGMHRGGIVIQVNAQSILGKCSFAERFRARKLLAGGIADIVASDCHNLEARPPLLSDAYSLVVTKYGKQYADLLFFKNAERLFELEMK